MSFNEITYFPLLSFTTFILCDNLICRVKGSPRRDGTLRRSSENSSRTVAPTRQSSTAAYAGMLTWIFDRARPAAEGRFAASPRSHYVSDGADRFGMADYLTGDDWRELCELKQLLGPLRTCLRNVRLGQSTGMTERCGKR